MVIGARVLMNGIQFAVTMDRRTVMMGVWVASEFSFFVKKYRFIVILPIKCSLCKVYSILHTSVANCSKRLKVGVKLLQYTSPLKISVLLVLSTISSSCFMNVKLIFCLYTWHSSVDILPWFNIGMCTSLKHNWLSWLNGIDYRRNEKKCFR